MGDGDASALPNALRYEELLGRRGAAASTTPSSTTAPGRGPLLHERHDRQPEGRPVLAPLEHPARDGAAAWRTRVGVSSLATACCRWCRCSTPTPGACPYAACLVGADLVMPGRFLQARAARAADRVREGDARRRACRRSGSTCCAASDEHKPDLSSVRVVVVRRRPPCPRRLMQRLRGAPRRPDHPGLGDDRDQPARPRSRTRRPAPRARSTGATAPRRAGSCRSSRRG